MNQTPGKSHLTALDILLELRCWLEDNVEMQADPAIVAPCLTATSSPCLTATSSPWLTASRSLMCC
ncbi:MULTISPECIES: hypothetical protein [Aeromonas]|uniref:hypothetical protein n=1 Tax=Aeromonas TaxID=642 RepID=UPI001F15F5F5|nr:hypothetical protein [Aeromonas caviae]